MTYHNIEIVFENVESIIIPASRILTLEYGQVKPSKIQYEGNTFSMSQLELTIGLHDISEITYDVEHVENPLGMFTSNPDSNRTVDRSNIFGRILYYNDITWILEEDEQQKVINSYSVPWSDNEFENQLMRTYLVTIDNHQYPLSLHINIGEVRGE